MCKITDSGYFLPVIHPQVFIKVMSSGTTQPMLISGICSVTGEKGDYVVKFINSPRMSVEASARELIASYMAMELDLNIPEPVLVEVSDEFVKTLKGKEGFDAASKSIGKNFGSKYKEGYLELLWNQNLSETQYNQALKIFTFDSLISNADRRTDKSNILTNGEKLLIFDHEVAFGFLLDLIKNQTPWIFSDHDISWLKNHFFYRTLFKNSRNFEDFVEKMKVLDNNFWDKLIVLLPQQWRTSQVDQIRNNTLALIEHKKEFIESLDRVFE